MNSIDNFWTKCFFDCSEEEYFNNKNIVCKHSFLNDYKGFFVLYIRNKFIISAPNDYIDYLKRVAKDNINFYDSNVWKILLKSNFDTIIGPAWIGYCNEVLSGKIDSYCRALNLENEEDMKKLIELKEQCNITEWEHSSIDTNSKVIIAKFLENKIVAAASYKLWGEEIAQVGIITHPLYRKQGYARNVLKALTTYGVERNMVMQYRTLSSNENAIKVAKACNYDLFATHISIRLR